MTPQLETASTHVSGSQDLPASEAAFLPPLEQENAAVSMTIRARFASGVATLVALTAWSCGTGSGPIQLTFQFGAAPGTSFVTTLTQNIAFTMGDHGAEGVRDLRLGYTVRGEEGAVGRDIVRVDSVRASIVWGQAQERIDARHLLGREFGMSVAARGGPPTYDHDSLPAVDMGERGGGLVPASLLIDYAFPQLPAEPATVGSTWSERRTGHRLQGTIWVTADVETTYRVTGTDRVGGNPCLRIESESTGGLSEGSGHGLTLDYTGQLTGRASWCFDAESGMLLEMTGEETTDGSTPWPNGATATFDQTTRVEIRNVGA